MIKIEDIIRLMRIEQWVKNMFVFFPLFFSGEFINLGKWPHVLLAFFAFCFASSGVYCLNDIIDEPYDRLHPQKRTRPIAAGKVSKVCGVSLMVFCWLCSALLLIIDSVTLHNKTSLYLVIVVYLALNILYSLRLKKYPIVDVVIIALGFVLRVVAGGLSTHNVLSQWIVMMSFLLALFLAFAKRRDEVKLSESEMVAVRKGIVGYNRNFLTHCITISASLCMVCYILYTLSEDVINRVGNSYLYITSVFVLAGFLRYLQVTLVFENSGSPTKVLGSDRFMQACILGWIISFVTILYL